MSLLVEGRLEARMSARGIEASELVEGEFDTVLLDNSNALAKVGSLAALM